MTAIPVGAHSVRPQTGGLIRIFDTSQVAGRQRAHTVRPYRDFAISLNFSLENPCNLLR